MIRRGLIEAALFFDWDLPGDKTHASVRLTRLLAVVCMRSESGTAIKAFLSAVALALLLTTMSSGVRADCAILLHGLARTASAMEKLEVALVERGFRVANVDYPSREMSIEALAPLAIESGLQECNTTANESVHFVTHSMGGILVRYYLESHSLDPLGHVVMIAPPNQGSEVVDALAKVPGFALLNGPAGLQLGTDENSIPLQLGPVDYSVGIIAGTTTFNPLLSQFLPNPDDGKVSVASTKVQGMADFRTVAASHPFIMKDDRVIEHVIAFLKRGSFDDDVPEGSPLLAPER